MSRKQLTLSQTDNAVHTIKVRLAATLQKKGLGTFASRHEILGMLTEEYNEFVQAEHNKDYTAMQDELIDIAVGCIFALACFQAKTIDW